MDLPEDVRRFLVEHIDTVGELEALLLVRRESSEPWTAFRLARRLYIDEPAAAGILDALTRAGFLIASDRGYVYGPSIDSLREPVETLAALHSTMLIPITRVIHSKPSAGVRRFADAFRFREKK